MHWTMTTKSLRSVNEITERGKLESVSESVLLYLIIILRIVWVLYSLLSCY